MSVICEICGQYFFKICDHIPRKINSPYQEKKPFKSVTQINEEFKKSHFKMIMSGPRFDSKTILSNIKKMKKQRVGFWKKLWKKIVEFFR